MLKNAIGIILIITLLNCKHNNETLIDLDGNSYATIKIDQTLWMAENLKVTQDSSGQTISYFYPNSNSANKESYGLLYDFKNACKVCPKGWKLPTNQDWEALFNFSTDNDARKYKDPHFWENEKNINTMAFSARPTGIGNNEEHPNNFNSKTLFWSSDKEEEHFIWTYIFEKGINTIRKASQHPTYAFSVRCIKKLN